MSRPRHWDPDGTRHGGTPTYLYRLALAKPVRPMTPAKAAALAKARAARRTCPICGQDAGYVLPAHLGTCLACADSTTIAA